jgi:hypothetical protein
MIGLVDRKPTTGQFGSRIPRLDLTDNWESGECSHYMQMYISLAFFSEKTGLLFLDCDVQMCSYRTSLDANTVKTGVKKSHRGGVYLKITKYVCTYFSVIGILWAGG